MSRLRLIKVVVRPIFVLDDGENLNEIDHPDIFVSAAEWPTYAANRFVKETEAWQEKLDELPSANDNDKRSS